MCRRLLSADVFTRTSSVRMKRTEDLRSGSENELCARGLEPGKKKQDNRIKKVRDYG